MTIKQFFHNWLAGRGGRPPMSESEFFAKAKAHGEWLVSGRVVRSVEGLCPLVAVFGRRDWDTLATRWLGRELAWKIEASADGWYPDADGPWLLKNLGVKP